ncbi:uncharacterized protein [Drosophila kikkawai]|uniref:Uncharacterized protein n=1 Tax=Drosophila kikkawai TaxID=30033 RepID=A0ABM4GAJ3_DROKI
MTFSIYVTLIVREALLCAVETSLRTICQVHQDLIRPFWGKEEEQNTKAVPNFFPRQLTVPLPRKSSSPNQSQTFHGRKTGSTGMPTPDEPAQLRSNCKETISTNLKESPTAVSAVEKHGVHARRPLSPLCPPSVQKLKRSQCSNARPLSPSCSPALALPQR